MESGTLRVLSMPCWWSFAARIAKKLLLYWNQYFVFPVVSWNYFSDTFNLISYMYDVETVLVYTGCGLLIHLPMQVLQKLSNFVLVQFLENRFCRHPKNPTNLSLKLQPNLLQFKQLINRHQNNIQLSHSFFNTSNILTIIYQILQLAQNSVYSTIFILIHNLITYTTLHTNHLKSNKNTITMAKSPPKRLDNKSNQRTSIQCHVKVKLPKNIQQQSYLNIEATKVIAIMEKLNKLNGNGRKTNINNFAPLFESYYEEGTKNTTKPKTPIIVLSGYEEVRGKKQNTIRIMKKMKTTKNIRSRQIWTTLIVTMN